ncbi:cytochrome B561 [Salinisphaera sp. PC39]|uniref:cytochrome b n=1 Tax=Salinisphaera sp. PC39 TaxID=1304156 RepID=UPI0033403029
MRNADRYSGLSTINHWVTAVLVLAMLLLGFMAAAAPNDDVEHYVMGIHVGLGFFVFLFVLWRTAVRLVEGFPPAEGDSAAQRFLAGVVPRLILLAIVVLVFTGPLYIYTDGGAVDVFGWFEVAVPLESLSAIHEPMETIHVITGLYILPVLLGLHFLGAIKHFLTRGRQETPADL